MSLSPGAFVAAVEVVRLPPDRRREREEWVSSMWSGRVADGKSVSMEVVRISQTYAGMYLGHPDQELNERIMADARDTAAYLFPGWPVYMVPPTITTRQIEVGQTPRTHEYPRIPSFECIGKFVASQTNADEYDGSLLIIVWYQDESPLRTIDLRLDDLEWLRFAQDFMY